MKASYLRHASYTRTSSPWSLHYKRPQRPFPWHAHTYASQQAVLVMSRCQRSSPPTCTHVFIKECGMWLLEMAGSLGSDHLKLKSSNITLKGTISQLSSGWKGRASLIPLCMQTLHRETLCWEAAVKTPLKVVKTFLLQITVSRCEHRHLDASCVDWASYGCFIMFAQNRWKCW